jgi:hypothetical protein
LRIFSDSERGAVIQITLQDIAQKMDPKVN